ncbi:MAG: hypothetical protein MJ188_00585 [Treponema sp.]|nr:hypothetical protein [Treponema sp.]
MKKIVLGSMFAFILSCGLFTACYSVFSGGTGGMVVDEESISNPKAGIANVDVYAYTDETLRNADFDANKKASWGTVFKPKAEYYGHTTTATDGSWSISKLVWKEKSFKSSFGKDADYEKIYLIFYHPDYGCKKGETLIMSDSFSDCIYTELKSIIKRTVVNLNFVDVASDSRTNQMVHYLITVPQGTDIDKKAESVVYSGDAVGNASVVIRYPRYKDAEKTENTPEISIVYYQNRVDEEVEWKACKNDYKIGDFSFIGDLSELEPKQVEGNECTFNLYGKKTKLYTPAFSGIYENTNGIEITMMLEDKWDCGSVTTGKHQISTDKTEDGYFSGLGTGFYWFDSDYTGRFAETNVYFYKGNGLNKSPLKIKAGASLSDFVTVRSDNSGYEIVLTD